MFDDVARRVRGRVREATLTDTRSLGIYRLVFAVFTILFHWPQFRWIGAVPQAFFDPPAVSPGALASGFPPAGVFAALDVAVLVLSIMVLVGLFTRTSSVLLFLVLLVGYQFQFSFGKIDHNFLYLCVLPVAAWLGWGESCSLDAGRRSGGESPTAESGRSLWLLGFLLAFGFLTAGLPKALAWLDFDLQTSGVLSWLYLGYHDLGRDALLAPLAIRLDSPLLWELADYAAVAFELGWIVALLSRRLWFGWLAAACVFHLFNALVLNIPFAVHAVVYLAFVPWSRLSPARRLARAARRRWGLVAGAAGIGAGVVYVSGGPGLLPSAAGLPTTSSTWLALVCALWIATLAVVVLGARRGPWTKEATAFAPPGHRPD